MNASDDEKSVMTTPDCVVFGAGEYYGKTPAAPQGALVIAADGGLDHVRAAGAAPDLVIGDFDSVSRAPGSGNAEDGNADDRVVRLPAEKDETDMHSAVVLGWMHGARRFDIHGGMGGRVDHTFANMQLLADVALHGGIAMMHGDGTVVTAIADGALSFPAWPAGNGLMVSVFAHSDRARHVTIAGFKYEVDDTTLTNTHALGVSNEFLPSSPAVIAVGDGVLAITYPDCAPTPRWLTHRPYGGPTAMGVVDTSVSSHLRLG